MGPHHLTGKSGAGLCPLLSPSPAPAPHLRETRLGKSPVSHSTRISKHLKYILGVEGGLGEGLVTARSFRDTKNHVEVVGRGFDRQVMGQPRSSQPLGPPRHMSEDVFLLALRAGQAPAAWSGRTRGTRPHSVATPFSLSSQQSDMEPLRSAGREWGTQPQTMSGPPLTQLAEPLRAKPLPF